jgi:hypothetical protein
MRSVERTAGTVSTFWSFQTLTKSWTCFGLCRARRIAAVPTIFVTRLAFKDVHLANNWGVSKLLFVLRSSFINMVGKITALTAIALLYVQI